MKKALVLFLALAMTISVAIIPASAAVGDLNSFDTIVWDFEDYKATGYALPTSTDTRSNWALGQAATGTQVRTSPITIDGNTAMLIETSHGAASQTGEGVDIWDAAKSDWYSGNAGVELNFTSGWKRDDNSKSLNFEFSFMLPTGWNAGNNTTGYLNRRNFMLQHQRGATTASYGQFIVRQGYNEPAQVAFFSSAYDNTVFSYPWADHVVGLNGVTNTTATQKVTLENDHWYRLVSYTDFKGENVRLILFDQETGQLIAEDYAGVKDSANGEAAGGAVSKYTGNTTCSVYGDSSYYSLPMGGNMKLIIDDVKFSQNKLSHMTGAPLLGYKAGGGYSEYATTGVKSNVGGVILNKVEDVVNASDYTGSITVPINVKSHNGVEVTSTAYFNTNGYIGRPIYCLLALYEDDTMIDVDIKKFDGFVEGNMNQVWSDTLTVNLAKEDMDSTKDYTLKKITLNDNLQPLFVPEMAY